MKNNSFWGPALWKMIHSSAFIYHPSNKHSYKSFIESLPYLLPCEFCRKHLKNNLKTLPLTENNLQNNHTLFYWTYILHDIVNLQLNKSSPSYNDIHYLYSQHIHQPVFWGPSYWRAIHSIATTYTMDNKEAFRKFIYALPGILPCEKSRKTFLKVLDILPLTEDYLQNKHTLFLWTYLIHDIINKQLGKISPSFEKVKQYYFGSLDCKNCSL